MLRDQRSSFFIPRAMPTMDESQRDEYIFFQSYFYNPFMQGKQKAFGHIIFFKSSIALPSVEQSKHRKSVAKPMLYSKKPFAKRSRF